MKREAFFAPCRPPFTPRLHTELLDGLHTVVVSCDLDGFWFNDFAAKEYAYSSIIAVSVGTIMCVLMVNTRRVLELKVTALFLVALGWTTQYGLVCCELDGS